MQKINIWRNYINMLLSNTVIIKWRHQTKNHYINKGYVYTKVNDEFSVSIYDLTNNSTAKLEFCCDECGELYQLHFRDFNNRKNKNISDKCKLCYRRCNVDKDEYYESVVKEEFHKRGLTLIDGQNYENQNTTLRYICDRHPNTGIHSTTLRLIKKRKSNCTCIKHNTSLTEYIRQSHSLAKWKLEVLNFNNYKCDITGESNSLEVHHLTSFHSIFDDVIYSLKFKSEDIDSYSKDELNQLESSIMKLHEVDVGIPLRKDVHRLFHATYGNKNNTNSQYKEFKERYLRGEFNEI